MRYPVHSISAESLLVLVLSAFLMALVGCDSGAEENLEASTTVAVRSTTGTEMLGTVEFVTTSESEDVLTISGNLTGLSQGDHGMHLHANGDCSAADTDGDGEPEPAGAAGPHYDRNDSGHGAPDDPPDERHYGDLGNISVTSAGDTATFTKTVERPEGFILGNDLSGRALVIHGSADDLETDPGGNSGARVGCGVL